MRLEYAPYVLDFKSPAGTSRGIMKKKLTCILRIFDEQDPSRFGIGEAAVFDGLSPEAGRGYELKLMELVANVALGRATDLSRHSSIQFGLEQAIRDFTGGCHGIYYPSDFTSGTGEIEINGLVWMGSFEEMVMRLHQKIEEGYHCVKFKIGAIDWDKELRMIKIVREEFGPEQLMVRVDANGGFTPENALPRMQELYELGVHSIEQPIPPGNPAAMARICRESPLPVALDEELIGCGTYEEREHTAASIHPAFLILKPALCGGFSGAEDWIRIASDMGIGWWVTSALESNVGLNAIAQWTASMGVKGPQGLGTGELFLNNFTTPLTRHNAYLHYSQSIPMDYRQFDTLDWRG